MIVKAKKTVLLDDEFHLLLRRVSLLENLPHRMRLEERLAALEKTIQLQGQILQEMHTALQAKGAVTYRPPGRPVPLVFGNEVDQELPDFQKLKSDPDQKPKEHPREIRKIMTPLDKPTYLVR